jgi:predicted SnoaL-like aldol condensation-catalyzing enzyme
MTQAAELLRRYYEEVWVAGRVEALDELLSPDYRDHDAPPGYGADRESARRLAADFMAGVRSPQLEILALVATADAAAAHWRFEWTGADGRRSLRGSDLIRVVDGRIAEIRHVERRA